MMTTSVALSSITDSHYSNANGATGELQAPAASTLYGRDAETALLLRTYQQVVSNNTVAANTRCVCSSKTVVLHGESGSGKTALIDTIRQPICENGGFFCAGKFFQNAAGIQEPYSAIMAAFSDLCDLIWQSKDLTANKRTAIQQALGSDGHLLAKAITSISPFLDPNQELDVTRDEAAFCKFKVACKTFLHTMAALHSIVLFIDDIQWADDGSRQLLRMLLDDTELTNVMLILAYRDEEAESVKDILTLQNQNNNNVVDIPLSNLEPAHIRQLVAELLVGSNENDPKMKDLSDLVALKTRGNAFHIIQFMDAIQREGFLEYDDVSKKWAFDVDKIQSEIMVSDKLADLLELKVRRLSPDVLQPLKIASLLGFRFDERIVLEVASVVEGMLSNRSNNSNQAAASVTSSVQSALQEALQGGFVEKTKEGYQFSHDKLQASFQSMFEDKEEEELHLVIGKTYLMETSAEAMYHAAVHLHRAPTYYSRRSKGNALRLARVNLQAALYCQEKSAFVDAGVLLRRGLALLDDTNTKWAVHYDLAFEMTALLAKMELIGGDLEACKEMTTEALARARTLEMKIAPLLIDVEVRMTSNEMDGSIAAAGRALKVLGITMPKTVGLRHVVMKLLNVKRLLGRKTDAQILGLPLMENRVMATAVQLLLHLCMYCFLKDEENPAVFSALLATQLTLQHGLSPHSAGAFTIYGLAELSNGNHRRAYRFGKLALQLLDQIKCKDADGPTTGLALTLLAHWKDPVREMPEKLLQAVENGFSVGDVVYGTYCLSMCYGMQILLGLNLKELEEFMRITYQKIKDLNRQDAMQMWAQAAIQYVLHMRTSAATDWKELTSLTGEIMKEPEYMQDAIEAKHPILIMIAWSYKAQLACFFGFWGMSESIYKDMAAMGPAFHFSYGQVPCAFFGGIASFSRYKETGNRKHLKIAKSYMKGLRRVQAIGSPNVAPFLTLLVAEELAVRKSSSPESVVDAYAKAIEAMAEEDLVHTEALANERAAFYHVEQGNRIDAQCHFNRAMDLYLYEWGATAKYEWLAEKSAIALERLDKKNENVATQIIGDVVGIGLSDILENSAEFDEQ